MNKTKIKTVIVRKVFYSDYKILVETFSMPTGHPPEYNQSKWSNCMYLTFKKSDYPLFDYNEDYRLTIKGRIWIGAA